MCDRTGQSVEGRSFLTSMGRRDRYVPVTLYTSLPKRMVYLCQSERLTRVVDFKNKRLKVESAVPAPTMTNAPNRDDVEVKIKGDKEFYNIEYDKLVIAVGCYSASLGIEGVSAVPQKENSESRSA